MDAQLIDRAETHILKNTSIRSWLKIRYRGKLSKYQNYEHLDNGWFLGLYLGFSHCELTADFTVKCQRSDLASSARLFLLFRGL